VRLASNSDRIHAAGAEVVAVSVDDDGRQAGMAKRWGLSHTKLVADPGGEQILKPLGLFDPEDRGGIGLPAVLVVGPDGTEVFRHEGRDFADRTRDAELYHAVEKLGLPANDPGPWTPEAPATEDAKGAFRPDDLGAYFRGNMFGAVAIMGRLDGDAEAKGIADEHRRMAKATLDAWKEHRARIG
jgi:hypothetical protein